MLEVDSTTSAYAADATPAYSGRGRPPKPGYPGKPANLRALALAAGRGVCRQVTCRQGTRKNSQPAPDSGDHSADHLVAGTS